MKSMKAYSILLLLMLFVVSCSVNSPDDDKPADISIPHNPSPKNHSPNQALAVELSWEAEGIEEFDVYFGRDPEAKLFYRTVSSKKVVVAGLKKNTQYFWRVVSKTSNNVEKEGPVWNFVTANTNNYSGYVMLEHRLFTELPNKVHIMFQVLDFQGRGISNLTMSDFEVLEDDQPISPTESQLNIKKRDEIDYRLRTVLLLDNSTSISSADLTSIKQAAVSFVDHIHPEDEIAIYEFSDKAVLLQDFTNDKDLLKNRIYQMSSGFATTNLYGSIVEAAKRLEDDFNDLHIQQSALVVFTDGRDTQGSSTFDDAVSALNQKRCYTVGLGNEIDPYVLENLGTAGFFSINDVSELKDQFIKIQNELYDFANSFYWVNYNSPKRGNKDHKLKLSIYNNLNLGVNSYIEGNFNSKDFFSIVPGIYINSSAFNPEGIDTLKMLPNESRDVFAKSYLLNNLSKYEWTTTNANVAKAVVKREPSDYSNATIVANANAQSGEETKIIVGDKNNPAYQKEIVVVIK